MNGGQFDQAGEPARDRIDAERTRSINERGTESSTMGAQGLLRLQATAGNRAVAGVIQRRVGGRTPDAAAPEQTSVDLTGRYEVENSGPSNRIMLQVNQAGRYVEAWWQRHVGTGGVQSYQRYRLRGTLTDSGPNRATFAYERAPERGHGNQTFSGTMSAQRTSDSAVEITLTEAGGWSRQLRQYSTMPRLADSAIASMPAAARELVRSAETTPLDTGEEALLRMLAFDSIDEIRRYLATSQANIARDVVALWG